MHTTANCYSTECKTRGLPCRYAEMTGADFSFDAQNYCCKNFSCSPPSVGQGYQCFNGHSMENNGCREYKVCAFPIRVCHDLFFLFSLCGAIIIMIMLLCTKPDVQTICQFGEVVHKKKNGIFVITYATNTLRTNLSSPDWTRNYL